MRHFLILFVLASSLLFLTGCGGGAEGMAAADGLAGEGLEGEGINALGMDDAPAGLADDATAFMKTSQDNGGAGMFPPITTSDAPNPMMNNGEQIPNLQLASASGSDSNRFVRSGINDPGTLVAGPAMHTPNPRDAAMLDALNFAEGKPKPGETFNYRPFTPGGDHPRKTICSGGHCSDAAGEYQIQSRTYDTYRRQAGVKGFTKPEQEKMATYLMKDVRGANPDNITDFASFNREMGKLCKEWASVRCSNGRGAYGQPTKTNRELWEEYQKSLKNRI